MRNVTVRPERPTFSNCADKWIRMNDKNCKATVTWYKGCADLANRLNGTRRESYSSALIENIKSTSDNYFRNSKRPLSSLSIIQKELSAVVERLLFPPQLTEKFHLKSEAKSDASGYSPVHWNINPDLILTMIWWLGVLTTLLTVVILIILCFYCVQYRKIKQRASKRDPCGDIVEPLYKASRCDCTRRIWDTGEPRKPNKPRPVPEDDTSDYCESDQELGLRFTVQGNDDSYPNVKKKPPEQRKHVRIHE